METDFEHIFASDLPSVQGMLFDYLDIKWSLKKHSTSVWELIYVDEGKVKLETKGNIYYGAADDMFFIPPETFHRDCFRPHLYRAYTIFFEWKRAPLFFGRIDNKKIKRIKRSARLEVRDIINKMWEEFKRGKPGFKLLINAYLQQIFVIIARNVLKPGEGDTVENDYRRRDVLNDIRRHIENYYSQQITLQSLSEKFRISLFYLTRLFSSEWGFSPHQYLINVRIDNAKRLLEKKNLSVKEVAYMTGFENPNYFGKVFKKLVGTTPAKYRDNFPVSRKRAAQ